MRRSVSIVSIGKYRSLNANDQPINLTVTVAHRHGVHTFWTKSQGGGGHKFVINSISHPPTPLIPSVHLWMSKFPLPSVTKNPAPDMFQKLVNINLAIYFSIEIKVFKLFLQFALMLHFPIKNLVFKVLQDKLSLNQSILHKPNRRIMLTQISIVFECKNLT